MDERKMRILQAVTNDYIDTAEPVGSRTIARKYKLGVSSATIRNEMADLEEAGYLTQPHTSAGRIPSDKGYRFYVDMLMDPHEMSRDEKRFVQEKFDSLERQIEELVHSTAHLLALLTRYISVAITPATEKATLKHIQLIALSLYRLLVILVTDPGFISNRIVELKEPITPEETERLSRYLNQRLRGLGLRDIGSGLIREMEEEVSNPVLLDHVMSMVTKGLDEGQERLCLDGAMNIFEQPEFRDIERARLLLNTLEEKDLVFSILDQTTLDSGVTVRIGGENKHEEVCDCSFVTATYEVRGQVIGSVGVVGPTRMHYSRTMAIVRFVSDQLSETLNSMWEGA